MSSPSDHQLMLQVRDGEVSDLGVLFERYNGMLYSFFMRMTGNRQLSEDLVQDVFFRILKYRHTYRDKSQFSTWMFKIARHVRFDDLRKRRHEVLVDKEDHRRASQAPIPIESLERGQEIESLHKALLKLAPEKREVLVLSRFQQMKYEQIGAILGCEVGAVKVRVYRAVRELREIFFNLVGERAS